MRTSIRLALVVGLAAVLAGPATAQPPQGRFGGGFGGRGNVGFLVQNEAVQKELKIDKDLAAKVAEAVKKVNDKHADAFAKLRDLEGDERRTKTRELTQTVSTETLAAVTEVLNPDQVKRLKQIELQRAGADAYIRSEIQAALKLSAEQKDKVKVIVDESNKQMQELRRRQGAPQGQGQGNRGANQEKITASAGRRAKKFAGS